MEEDYSRYGVKEETREMYRDWAGLPNDLLTLILTHIYSYMHVKRFHAVCRSWYSISDPNKPPSQWLISGDYQFETYEFIHSYCCKDNYSFYIPKGLRCATLLYSNNGWLLLSQWDKLLFFFNPFTKERVDLPDLRHVPLLTNGFVFVEDPISPHCMVVRFEDNSPISTFGVHFIHSGQDKWHKISFDGNDQRMDRYASHPVFHNNKFYALGDKGNSIVIDVKEKKLEFHQISNMPPEQLFEESYLVECQGQLVAVFLSYLGEEISVLRLDEADMEWRTVDDLGDMMLFVSQTTSYAMKKVKDEMGNKIYFPRTYRDSVVFYCLATRLFKTFDNFSQNNLNHTEKRINYTWIQPNTCPTNASDIFPWELWCDFS